MSNIVLVTGADGGIGLEICKKFKLNNWIVIGTSLIKKFDHISIDWYISGDLNNIETPKNIINYIRKKYNRLDCIVNNAAHQICKPIWEMESEEWDMTYNCNVKCIYLFTKYCIDLLKESKGNIINIGSVHSVATSMDIAAYASSKAAIVGLTKNLAIELGKFNIRVNCISPGAIDTAMLRASLVRDKTENISEEMLLQKIKKLHLLDDIGNPSEIANFVYFISNNCNFINGSNIVIDGGASIKLSTE